MKAYTYYINPHGSGTDENKNVHQSSPAWVLTFVRWANRDTYRTAGTASTDVRAPLVVENDCIQISTSMNKSTQTPSMQAVLVMTDINYETAIFPGDFVFVNILNWESHARLIANNARAGIPINGFNDGFKGMFKVQAVRRVLGVDPATGVKTVMFRITGFAFTEFNNTIYFNPYMLDAKQDPKNELLFASYVGRDWSNLINKKGFVNCQDLISVLIQSFIGSGVNGNGRKDKLGNVISPNSHFYMPALVGQLLGQPNVKSAADIYNYLFGIQSYAPAASGPQFGFNPVGVTEKSDRFFYTGENSKIQGSSLLKAEFWNQVKAWSIINQYTNSPLNEFYTCFRISPDAGDIMPTVVLRQIPFSNLDFKVDAQLTQFLNLPRWKINSSLIMGLDIGRDEAARINFVQFFGRSTITSSGAPLSLEIAQKNYFYDVADVQRSGLRPYIITTQFDEPSGTQKAFSSPTWAMIIADALIGGHAKLNGTLNTVGLVEPITVGDNLELDGTVYHIEEVTHIASIASENGKKTFRTNIALSSGISTSSSTEGTRYSEMTYTKASDATLEQNQQTLRKEDFKNNKLLPGVSESQDTVYRKISPDIDDPGHTSNAEPFVQPNTKAGTAFSDGQDGNSGSNK